MNQIRMIFFQWNIVNNDKSSKVFYNVKNIWWTELTLVPFSICSGLSTNEWSRYRKKFYALHSFIHSKFTNLRTDKKQLGSRDSSPESDYDPKDRFGETEPKRRKMIICIRFQPISVRYIYFTMWNVVLSHLKLIGL